MNGHGLRVHALVVRRRYRLVSTDVERSKGIVAEFPGSHVDRGTRGETRQCESGHKSVDIVAAAERGQGTGAGSGVGFHAAVREPAVHRHVDVHLAGSGDLHTEPNVAAHIVGTAMRHAGIGGAVVVARDGNAHPGADRNRGRVDAFVVGCGRYERAERERSGPGTGAIHIAIGTYPELIVESCRQPHGRVRILRHTGVGGRCRGSSTSSCLDVHIPRDLGATDVPAQVRFVLRDIGRAQEGRGRTGRRRQNGHVVVLGLTEAIGRAGVDQRWGQVPNIADTHAISTWSGVAG